MTIFQELPEPEQLGNFKQPLYNADQMRAYAELAIADKDAELLRLHIKLAGETLRADQGWQRYEAANRMCLHQQEEIAPVKREPMSDQQIDDAQERAYRELRASGYSGSMGGLEWDRASARAIEQAHGIGGISVMEIPSKGGAHNELPSYHHESPREKALNALLWFYRRAKPNYGRLPFAEEAIALLQRGPDPITTESFLRPIATAPKDESTPFLVLVPKTPKMARNKAETCAGSGVDGGAGSVAGIPTVRQGALDGER